MKPVLLVFCLFAAVASFAQDSIPRLHMGVRLNKLDFFAEGSVLLPKKKVMHEFGLGLGINRSIFQKRPFPEFFYGLHSNFKPLGFFSYQGMASYHVSFFQANKNQPEMHFFNELLLGAYFGIGHKYAFFFQPQVGFLAESFRSDFFDRVETGFSFAYSAKIGISHAF